MLLVSDWIWAIAGWIILACPLPVVTVAGKAFVVDDSAHGRLYRYVLGISVS